MVVFVSSENAVPEGEKSGKKKSKKAKKEEEEPAAVVVADTKEEKKKKKDKTRAREEVEEEPVAAPEPVVEQVEDEGVKDKKKKKKQKVRFHDSLSSRYYSSGTFWSLGLKTWGLVKSPSLYDVVGENYKLKVLLIINNKTSSTLKKVNRIKRTKTDTYIDAEVYRLPT